MSNSLLPFVFLSAFVFSTCLAGTCCSQDDAWGDLRGQIRVTGEIPDVERERIDRDLPNCLADREPPLDDNLVIGRDGGLRDVFVMMYRKADDPLPPIHPDYEVAKAEPVILDNRQCRFQPHAMFVRTGQTLRMKNSDEVGHNCHITLFNNEENVNIPIGEHVDVKLTQFEKVPGNVVCDIHKWMDAVLLVRDEPYVAISDQDGKFEIKNIPAGSWKFQFWHRRVGYLKSLQIEGKDVGRRGEIKIAVKNGETLDLGTMKLDAAAIKKR